MGSLWELVFKIVYSVFKLVGVLLCFTYKYIVTCQSRSVGLVVFGKNRVSLFFLWENLSYSPALNSHPRTAHCCSSVVRAAECCAVVWCWGWKPKWAGFTTRYVWTCIREREWRDSQRTQEVDTKWYWWGTRRLWPPFRSIDNKCRIKI